MDTTKLKLKKVLDSVKINVEDIDAFEKDAENILKMFDQIKEVDVDSIDASLHKKKIKISDLREDIAIDANFRIDMRGKYFKVPTVSKKKSV